MPAAAWVTVIVAALIIAITAVGLLRVIFHLRAIARDARPGDRRRAGGRPADQHRAGPADLGEREPEAGPRLLRDGVRARRWNPMTRASGRDVHHRLDDRLHDRHHRGPGRGRAGGADPAAGPVDRQRGAEDQRRARPRRCRTPRRSGRCAPPSSTPRSSSAGCSAAAPGWEVSDGPHVAGHVLHRAHPVGDRDHRRLRRGAGGRGAAQPAHLPGEDHRPPGRRDRGTRCRPRRPTPRTPR